MTRLPGINRLLPPNKPQPPGDKFNPQAAEKGGQKEGLAKAARQFAPLHPPPSGQAGTFISGPQS